MRLLIANSEYWALASGEQAFQVGLRVAIAAGAVQGDHDAAFDPSVVGLWGTPECSPMSSRAKRGICFSGKEWGQTRHAAPQGWS